MKNKEPYDPEDLESLLMHKSFKELYPEEKAFVLRHISSEQEYESMRKTLQSIVSGSNSEPLIKAPSRIKKNLMAEFKPAQNNGWVIWLNTFKGWLWPSDVQPLFRPALIAVVGLLGVMMWWYFTDSQEADLLADIKEPPKVEEVKPLTTIPSKEETASSSAERPTTATSVEPVTTGTDLSITETSSASVESGNDVALADEHEMTFDTAPLADQTESTTLFQPPSSQTKSLELIAEDDLLAPVDAADTEPVSTHIMQAESEESVHAVQATQVQEVVVARERISRKATNLFSSNNKPEKSLAQQRVQEDKAVLSLLYTAY